MGSLLDQAEAPVFDAQFSDDFGDDFPDELEVDPPSAAFAPEAPPTIGKRLAKVTPAGPVVSAATRRRIAAEIQLYVEVLAGITEIKCEECAKVIEAHSKKVAERAADILGRYPDMAEKFIKSGLIAAVVGLGAAVKPIAKQVIGHHVTHSIGEEGGHGDATDYAEYGPYRPA